LGEEPRSSAEWRSEVSALPGRLPNDGLIIGWLPEVSCWRGVGEANRPSTTMIRNGCEERAKNNQEVGPPHRLRAEEKTPARGSESGCVRSSAIEKPERSATKHCYSFIALSPRVNVETKETRRIRPFPRTQSLLPSREEGNHKG